MGADPLLPDLEEVAAAARREMRAEAEEAEREAAVHAAMQRTIGDVLREAMARGDVVAVSAAGTTVRGRVRHVGADFASLDVSGSRVDAGLAVAPLVEVVEHARSGGVSASPHEPANLRARLLELRLCAARVTLSVAGTDETLDGRVLLVGADHVALASRDDDRARWFVPLAAIGLLRADPR